MQKKDLASSQMKMEMMFSSVMQKHAISHKKLPEDLQELLSDSLRSMKKVTESADLRNCQ